MKPDLPKRPSNADCEICGNHFEIAPKGPVPVRCPLCRKASSNDLRRARRGTPVDYVCIGCGRRFARVKWDGPIRKRCPDCSAIEASQRSADWQRENREKHNANARQWRANNPNESREASRKSQAKRRRERPDTVKREKVRSKYGLSDRQLDELYERSGGCCEACGVELTEGGNKKACIDHDHQTGIVRGLLCTRCNTALGMLDDDPQKISLLSTYLARAMSPGSNNT